MLSSLCRENIPINFRFVNPQIKELAKSRSIQEFHINFKRCTSLKYDNILHNLDKLITINENDKFYFDENDQIFIHTNYLGNWSISVYRQLVGLGRENSINDLTYFFTKVKLFLNKAIRYNCTTWEIIPKTKIGILLFKVGQSMKGILKIKETYNDDKLIKNKLNDIINDLNQFKKINSNTLYE